jgi:hypothetical protein
MDGVGLHEVGAIQRIHSIVLVVSAHKNRREKRDSNGD